MVDTKYYLKIKHRRCIAWGLYDKRATTKHKRTYYCVHCECYFKFQVQHLHIKDIRHHTNVIKNQKNLFSNI